jgi:hypothetical protein
MTGWEFLLIVAGAAAGAGIGLLLGEWVLRLIDASSDDSAVGCACGRFHVLPTTSSTLPGLDGWLHSSDRCRPGQEAL